MKSVGVKISVNADILANLSPESLESFLESIPTNQLLILYGKRLTFSKKDYKQQCKKNIIQKNICRRIHSIPATCSTCKEPMWRVYEMKIVLPSTHLFVQMDFAEDYKCSTQNEVQLAYWNSTHVTIHSTVIYYKQNNSFVHKRAVYIPDEKHHSVPKMYAILQKLVPTIEELVPSTKAIHYWTDSPTSQHRTKSIFYITAHREEHFWDFCCLELLRGRSWQRPMRRYRWYGNTHG